MKTPTSGLFLALAVVVLTASAARAQCTMDTECKGDRVCEAGQCVSPPPGTGAVTVPPPPPPSPPRAENDGGPGLGRYADKQLLTRPRHWAGGAGVIGIIGSLAVAGLAIPATSTGFVGTLFGALAVTAATITGILVLAGSGSARKVVAGAPGARITGMILYIAALTLGAAMVVVGLLVDYPPPLVLGVAGLGVAGLILMSIDAFVASGQANALPEAPRASRARPSVVPLLSAVRTANGSLAPTVGVGVVF